MALEVGTTAPEFSLPDQSKNPVALTDLRGSKTVVAFMPFAFSGVCTGEVCELRDNLTQLKSLDANVVVITVDSFFTNGRWAESEGIEYPVLSDYWPHGATAKAYDTFNEALGCADRTTYILDEAGIIRSALSSQDLGTARNYSDYVTALEAI